ncbi:MAG: argininosuccinate synthase [Alphaproteobacteria bacterium]|nr:argininosuccinate synthase [Alphaproteobacteria bacterium]NDC55556.1 argininosuccinate synthase [Alphaproteobacteria bacterium]NDG03822.1 argininosuccinate synthase [Alphaproteobacteria bacterium]
MANASKHPLSGQTIAFAASGGLDSCTITHWLAQQGVRVVAITADLGQPDETDFGAIEQRMRACGAADFAAISLQKEMAEGGLEVIQAQSTYEGRYWNTTGVGRVITTQGLMAEVLKRQLTIFSHGATGRGNDQVRFQLMTNMLAPHVQVYAPWRDDAFLQRFGGRQHMIAYCEQHGLPIKATRDKPYSTDANLLGLTHEGGQLESLLTAPDIVTPGMGVWPKDAPNAAEDVTIVFERGRPVSINGSACDVLQAMFLANNIGGRHGIGIGTHLVENRFVGVKSRGVYEAPGMELLGTAYALLVQLVLDRRAREFLDQLGLMYARQIYQGYYFDVCSQMVRAALAKVSALISGSITVRLLRGNISYVRAEGVPHSLYTLDGSMEAEGSFNHADSEGFLKVLGVNARAIARAGHLGRL